MNKIENLIYNAVKSQPWLKLLIRNIYQSIFDCLPRKKEWHKYDWDYKENYFFGFHDISPLSADETKALAHHTVIPLRMPAKGESVELGYFTVQEGKLGTYHQIGESFAWNYHKGCRLQWLSATEIIYNTGWNNRLVSVIFNVDSKREEIIDYPVDSVSPNGAMASSFSYERLEYLMPGYGYCGYADGGYLAENAPKDTGLFGVDLRTNERKLLVSLETLAAQVETEESGKGFRHYVTHSEFSVDNRFLAFLHRWVGKDVKKRWSRLVVYDLKEQTFFALPTTGMVSHYVWNKENKIVAYCSINGVDCHAVFDVLQYGRSYEMILPEYLNSDGHQSFVTHTTFVTDTYPDRYRMSYLYRVDIESHSCEMLAKVYSPKAFQTTDFTCHKACDLHPRVSPKGTYVSFDSPRTGHRSFYLMKLH